ncbi:MAG: PAC2 family protein [Dehalococcoidia bacterium]
MPIKLHKRPRLRQPYLVAAGPGTGNVGLMTVDYLKDRLGAELLAEIEPGDFFSASYAFLIQDGVAELKPAPPGEIKPENKFYYWKGGKTRDLLFFVGNTHPLQGKGRQFADMVLDLAARFGAKTLFIPGAFVTDIHHKREPRIFGVVSKRELLHHLQEWNVEAVPPISVAFNLNTWLLTAAIERDIDALGLITEIPFYTAEAPNPRACRALLGIMREVLGLSERLDIASLDEFVSSQERMIDEKIEELKTLPDERSREFLAYLEQLERGGEGISSPEPPLALRRIEKLYTQARKDPSKLRPLRDELNRLADSDRLEVFRRLGDELLDLFKTEP